VFGYATQGDVNVVNDGSHREAMPMASRPASSAAPAQGDVNVTNTGSIEVITGGNVAVGVFARADYGTAAVNNSGDIVASVEGVNGYIGDYAYGILAIGEYAQVANAGSIDGVRLLLRHRHRGALLLRHHGHHDGDQRHRGVFAAGHDRHRGSLGIRQCRGHQCRRHLGRGRPERWRGHPGLQRAGRRGGDQFRATSTPAPNTAPRSASPAYSVAGTLPR
jgi:hypothetical protein